VNGVAAAQVGSGPGSWRRGLVALSATLGSLLLVACAPGDGDGGAVTHGPVDPSATQRLGPEEYAARLLAETQAVRDEEGVPRLESSDCATGAALSRASALVGFPLEHAPLDDVVAACRPPGGTAAENLSRASAEPAAVVDAWMGSHGHRANLLDPTLTSVGVACVEDATEGAGVLVCAQVFLG
jgi:uncharacterized protein YkwD